MKKIFAVSLIAFMAVSASHAAVVTTNYVDPASDGTYVSSSNTTGQNIYALDSQFATNASALTTLNGTGEDSIKAAVDNKIGTLPSGNATVADYLNSVATTAGGGFQNVTNENVENGIVDDLSKDGTDLAASKTLLVSADFADNAITDGKLESGVQTSLGKADNSLPKTVSANATNPDGAYIFTKTVSGTGANATVSYAWEAITGRQ